jgi:hypothetical protein
MLSFIYRLVKQYEARHGYPPNLLEISPEHFFLLKQSLPLLAQHNELRRFLGMRILFSRDAVHPHVAWSAIAEVESA